MAQVRYILGEDSAGCNASGNRAVTTAVTTSATAASNLEVYTVELELEVRTFGKARYAGNQVNIHFVTVAYVISIRAVRAGRVAECEVELRLRKHAYCLSSSIDAAICIFKRKLYRIIYRSNARIAWECNLRTAAAAYIAELPLQINGARRGDVPCVSIDITAGCRVANISQVNASATGADFIKWKAGKG